MNIGNINTLWCCLRLSAITRPKERLFYVTRYRVFRHAISHVTKIAIDQDEILSTAEDPYNNGIRFAKESFSDETSMWVDQGQGWSSVGSNTRVYCICWEGSTLLQGAYAKELNESPHWTPSQHVCTTHVLPLSTTRDGPLETPSSSYRSSQRMVHEGINLTGRTSVSN